jgi:hypothetical protein
MDIDKMKEEAFYYRDLLRSGAVDYDTAKSKIMPWLNAFNKIAKEKAKKHNVKSFNVTFASFVR